MEWEVSTWASRSQAGHTAIGALIAAAFFIGFPTLARTYWLDMIAAIGGPRSFGFWAPFFAHASIFWPMNSLYTLLYVARIPWVEQYRVGRQPWAWMHPKEGERSRFLTALRYALLMVTFNQLHQLVIVYLTLPLITSLGALSVSLSDFPSLPTLAWQLLACLAVEDAMFYWTHRTLHSPSLYPHIHKVHHTFYHTICWSSEMAHPVEYVVGNLTPVLAGCLLLRAHMIVFIMFIWVRIFVSVEEHCGYAFPWSPARILPFGASVEGHDYHHSRNKGMFASQFIFWDWLCGTDRAFQSFMEEEKRLKAAPTAALDESGDPDVVAPAPADGRGSASSSGGKRRDGAGK